MAAQRGGSAAGQQRMDLGQRGERAAEALLRSRGHEVLARRFRTRHGEVDLITRRGAHLYFIEVKTRRRASARFGGGLGAIDARKLLRMHRAAEAWLVWREGGVPHLGLVVVDVDGDSATVRFLPDAA